MDNKIIYRNNIRNQHSVLHDTGTGSEFWSIEGKHVQLTYFDVPAKRSFPVHKHQSEQITYVLEGELFFKSSGIVYKLIAGDSIFIPGNAEHEVWTENVSAKAIDAWSPVSQPYLSKQQKLKV